jgi:hypothetical protein
VAVAGASRGLEAMTDACRALGGRSAARRTLVYVGGRSLGVASSDTSVLMQAIGQNRVTPMIVLLLPAGRDASLGGVQSEGTSWDVQSYFESMSKAYGGSYAESFSTMAVQEWLRRAAADAGGQYTVRYESSAEPGPLKVTVARKDTRLRTGRPRQVETVAVGELQATRAER